MRAVIPFEGSPNARVWRKSIPLSLRNMTKPRSHSLATRRSGFALVEVAISLVIFTVATAMLLMMLRAGHGMRGQAKEEWCASTAAQVVLEEMRNGLFETIPLHYDADPFNDPGGPGTSHGPSFDVDGLSAAPDDPDGRVGEIILPVVNVGGEVAPRYEIREDIGDAALGLPRDLNGDAIIDSLDHRGDVAILPVIVRMRWKGRNGIRTMEFFTAVTEVR